MGKHITDDGKLRSDKFRVIRIADGADVSDDKVVLSLHDRDAVGALYNYCIDADGDFADDVFERLNALAEAIAHDEDPGFGVVGT